MQKDLGRTKFHIHYQKKTTKSKNKKQLDSDLYNLLKNKFTKIYNVVLLIFYFSTLGWDVFHLSILGRQQAQESEENHKNRVKPQFSVLHFFTQNLGSHFILFRSNRYKIGRASCRERV